MPEPHVTIVVLHHSGADLLQRCLNSLFKTEYSSFKVVVVDNGSSDGSVESVLKKYGGRITVLRSDINLGFVAGNNFALKQIDHISKYVVLLNNDTLVEPSWLKRLVEAAEDDISVGAVMPKLLSLTNPSLFEYNGACGGMLDVYGVPFCRGRIFDYAEEDRGQYDKLAEVFWASGAAFFAPLHVLKEAGLLDELLYAHMEEIDLCWRIRLLGYKVLCVPSSIVYHLGGGTELKGKFYLKQRNNLIVMLKNYSLRSLLRYFTARMILDGFSIIYFLTKKERERCYCVLKSYIWILRNMRRIWLNRLRTQKLRRVDDQKIIGVMCKGNISLQYYLLKRRRFTQIAGLPNTLSYYLAWRTWLD